MRALFVLLVVAACSKSDSAAPARDKPKGEMGEHHEGMPPALDKFHDVLAPHWHAEKGEQRMKDTCAAIGAFHSGAEAVAKAKSDAAWTASATELQAAVDGLDATCKANDATGFELAFEKVHQSFHKMLEAGGGEH